MIARSALLFAAALSALPALAGPVEPADAPHAGVIKAAAPKRAAAKPAAAPAQPAELRINAGGEGVNARTVTLGLGKAIVVDLPADARDVLLSDPLVADAVMRTARRAFLIGRKLGQTNLFFFDAQGRQIANLEIRVEPDMRGLNDLIRTSLPSARVQAEAVNGTIVLNGMVKTVADADRIVQMAERFMGASATASGQGQGQNAGSEVVNLLTIEGRDQVLVKVRVVEMNRSLVKQLGMNLNAENILNQLLPEDVFVEVATANGFPLAGKALGGLSATGGVADNILRAQGVAVGSVFNAAPQQFSGAGPFDPRLASTGGFNFTPANPPSNPFDTFTFGPGELVTKSRVDASINAFERAGMLKVLAEPNLTAISGEAGKFLAGGEFPIPVNNRLGEISIEFKPFGVGLAFTPTVLSEGRISLKLATEVSELTAEGAITLGEVSIPALQVRRAETTVEMPSGGALVIAGLLQERTRQAIEGVPGAKDLPVFGALFRSRDFVNNETELVIIVTPYLVQPTHPDKLRTPIDGLQTATDGESLLFGRLNRVYRTAASDTEGKSLKGPFGFVLPRSDSAKTSESSKP